MHLTKTDYLDYTFCKKNLWLKKHKPELFDGVELSDFERKIIEEGNVADAEARQLFPGGVLVDSHGADAVNDTKQYIENKEKIIFQATFAEEVFFIRADILMYDEVSGGYELYEVKASNDVSRNVPNHYVNDLAFQKSVIEKSGLCIVKTGVIHLNREYRRQGAIDHKQLFVIADLTDEVVEAEELVRQQMADMQRYLGMAEEKGCECLYRGRKNQCTTFAYSNPNVPEYAVYDLNRIGASKKLFHDWIDRGIFALEDIDNPEKLKGAKKAQYEAYIHNRTIIDHAAIAEVLDGLTYPLQFFDYEGFVSAIPICDGFGAYDQIPFQYSLHIVREDGSIEHKEFLITELTRDATRPLVERMKADIDPNGTVVSWHSAYEKTRNKKLMELHPDCAVFLETINDGMFDLKTVFSDCYYVDPKFRGSASIKNILPVLVPELTYKSLNISKGDQAVERWERLMFGEISEQEKQQITADLLEYCKMDTWAMVRIWQVLRGVVRGGIVQDDVLVSDITLRV